MHEKTLRKSLIQQEKRAAKLFLVLLLGIVSIIDIGMSYIFLDETRLQVLLPFALLFLLLPVGVYYARRQNPRLIKYIFFVGYITASFVNELFMFWGSKDYTGGNAAEIFFVLFSPIFINRRYYWTVAIGTFAKYVLMGVLLQSAGVVYQLAVLLILSVIAYIILSRFLDYLQTMTSSFYVQFESVVKGVASMLELKDPATRGHSQRVARYAVILADALNIYGADDLKLIHYACLLHDVGKVHIPDYVLSKPGKLTEEEYALIKMHPTVGAEALKDIEGFELCVDIVLYHHERWDGKGYPAGLKETQIPLTARIAAIADSFDAMTSQRSYRGALSVDHAYQEIVQGSGSQYDPALVQYFSKVYPQWLEVLKQGGSDTGAALQSAAGTVSQGR